MTISIELSDELSSRLRRLAAASRTTRVGLLQEAVEQYVDREEKREAFRQDALDSLDHYRRTGLHVTQSDGEAWLLKLEAGEDAEPPECHV